MSLPPTRTVLYVDDVCVGTPRFLDKEIAMFHKIMVAFDESSEASRALRASIDLAKALRAELNVVTVLEPIPGYYSFAVSAVSAWNHRLQALCSMRT